MKRLVADHTANRDIINDKKHFHSTYKHFKATIAFVLMIIAATGWCV